MDYQKHYDRLTQRARNRILEGYKESHHVIPKCLGGSDDPENLVDLTPEEHYVAHQLLVKIHPGNGKLVHAAVMMSATGHTHRSNKCYGWLKRKTSTIAKQRVGDKNGSFGTMWVNDGNKSFKIRKDQPVPTGCSIGRLGKQRVCLICSVNLLGKRSKYCHLCRSHLRLEAGKKIQKVTDEQLIEMFKTGMNGNQIFKHFNMYPSKNNYVRLKRITTPL